MDNFNFIKMIKSTINSEKVSYFYIYLKINYRYSYRMNAVSTGYCGEISTDEELNNDFFFFVQKKSNILITKYNFYGYSYSYEDCCKQYYLYQEQENKHLLSVKKSECKEKYSN